MSNVYKSSKAESRGGRCHARPGLDDIENGPAERALLLSFSGKLDFATKPGSMNDVNFSSWSIEH